MRLMDGEYYDNKPSSAFYPAQLVTARDSPASDKWRSYYFDNEFEALVWWYNQPDRSKLIVQHWRPSTGWVTIAPSVVKGD